MLNILVSDLNDFINHTLRQYKKKDKRVINKIKECKSLRQLLIIRKKLHLVEWD
jgi:hypothetical protein